MRPLAAFEYSAVDEIEILLLHVAAVTTFVS